MRNLNLLLLAILLAGGAAAETAGSGAKELFYDPADRNITNVSQPRPASPRPASPRPSGQPVRRATPVRLDSQGRRLANEPQKALGLSYWIELVEADGRGTQVTTERIFRSGERIRLHFRSNAEGHIALIQMGSSGTSSVLFPDPEKALRDDRLAPNQDRVLPSEGYWFRFDDQPGTERLLVLFSRSESELDSFPVRPAMDAKATVALLQRTGEIQGSKDLVVETEIRAASEIGTYGVNLSGKPVVLEIVLKHQ